MYDEFNPDSTVRTLPDLYVLKKNGSEVSINNRIVKLDVGAALDLTLEDNEIVVDTSGASDLYYTQKFDALKNLVQGGTPSGPYVDPDTGITPEGDAWSFTDLSLFFSKIDSIPAEQDTGVIYISNDSCTNLVQGVNSLTILDICGPCIDCPTYDTLQTYLERINEVVKYVWRLTGDKVTNTIPIPPDGTELENFSGIYLQSLTALNYWNYLVHKQSVKSNAQSFGQSVSAASYYRNISPSTVSNIEIEVKFRFMQRTAGGSLLTWDGVAPGNTEVRVIDREGVNSASLLAGPAYTANTITVTLDAGTLLSSEEVYGDVILMITDTSLFDTEVDQILILVETTFNTTHIGTNILLTDTIYFRATDGETSGSA